MFEVAELLTAAGVFVAILAAIYARHAARAAKRQAEVAEHALRETKAQSALAHGSLQAARVQNKIALHVHRMETYRAFLAFESEVNTRGHNFSKNAILELCSHAHLSEFYFPEPISTGLTSLTDLAIKAQFQAELASETDTHTADEIIEIREKRNFLYLQLSDHLEKVGEDIRTSLKLVR